MIQGFESSETFAIFTFGDVLTHNSLIRANTIIDQLLAQRLWYTTKMPKAVRSGTRILLYQNMVGFRASAVIEGVFEEARSMLFHATIPFLFTHRLTLVDIDRFDKPLALAPLVSDLAFIKNKVYWGTALRSTPRTISATDYLKIVKHAHGDG